VTEWFDEPKSEVEHSEGLHTTSELFKTTLGFWRSKSEKPFAPPASYSDLDTVQEEEWLKIPLTCICHTQGEWMLY